MQAFSEQGIHEVKIRTARLSDIAPVFNLVQACCMDGHFNPDYLLPRFQAGLALQLFSIVLVRKIRLPDYVWYPATLHVARQHGQFAGFTIVRYVDKSGSRQEIYMCAVDSRFRQQGVGRRLLQIVLERQVDATTFEAECLSNSLAMKKLLQHAGFTCSSRKGKRPDAKGKQHYWLKANSASIK